MVADSNETDMDDGAAISAEDIPAIAIQPAT